MAAKELCGRSKPIFKKYPQHQTVLLPPSLEELIDTNHPARVVNRVMDQINLDPLRNKYKGGGTTELSSAHAAQGGGVWLPEQCILEP